MNIIVSSPKLFYWSFKGETIRVFRRSRSGHPVSGTKGGRGVIQNNLDPEKGDSDADSLKHMEDLPAPDTPAAAMDAGIK